MNDTTGRMEKLPIDVLENISKHLTTEELAACAAVSRHCRNALGADVLWKPRCDEALEETLRTTPCVVEPPFVCPEEVDSLSPIGRCRLAYMRERHLWSNWRRDNFKVASVPEKNVVFHTVFISNDLILRVFDLCSHIDGRPIKLYNVKQYPPILVKEIPNNHGKFFKQTYYNNNNLVLSYDEYSVVFKLDMDSESILDFKYKIFLPILESPNENSTEPQFRITQSKIFGWNPIMYNVSKTLHVWDMEDGTEIRVEKSPIDKPYGFSDVITSHTTDNAVVVVSNDINCEHFMLCAHFDPKEDIAINYYFYVYDSKDLNFLSFTEAFEVEHRDRYQCKILRCFLGIAVGGVLKIYNYRSHHLLMKANIEVKRYGNTTQKSCMDVIDDCFAFVTDHTFRMFHPASRTFVALVDLQVVEFRVITNCLVKMVGKERESATWKISRHDQHRIQRGVNSDMGKEWINKSSTRRLTEGNWDYFEDYNSIIMLSSRSIFECPFLTECLYYW